MEPLVQLSIGIAIFLFVTTILCAVIRLVLPVILKLIFILLSGYAIKMMLFAYDANTINPWYDACKKYISDTDQDHTTTDSRPDTLSTTLTPAHHDTGYFKCPEFYNPLEPYHLIIGVVCLIILLLLTLILKRTVKYTACCLWRCCCCCCVRKRRYKHMQQEPVEQTLP